MQGPDMENEAVEPETGCLQTATERGHEARFVASARLGAAQPGAGMTGRLRIFRIRSARLQ
jgi:hypothetical protein